MSAGEAVEWWEPGSGKHRVSAPRDAVQRSVTLPRRLLAVAAVAVLVAVIAVVAVVVGGSPGAEPAPALPAARAAPASSAAVGPAGPVVVSVVGKVRRPGLVRLKTGARVADAVKAAGGIKRGVDLATVNLARRVTDGEQIHVGAPAAAGVPGDASVAAPGGKLSLNSATAEQLEELPGIGEVTAGNIIDWRSQHGGFTAVEQLREVDGIGERRLATLRERVTV